MAKDETDLVALVAHLERMRVGLRVRANVSIFYACSGLDVSEGTQGEIVAMKCGGAVVAVRWDTDWYRPMPPREFASDVPGAEWTSFSEVEVVPS